VGEGMATWESDSGHVSVLGGWLNWPVSSSLFTNWTKVYDVHQVRPQRLDQVFVAAMDQWSFRTYLSP